MDRSEPVGRRLTIIGGGVMGLMTAYYAAPQAGLVTVLERSRVGDPATASYGRTRSVRHDYLDPRYAELAAQARRLWLDLQQAAGTRLLIDCGCLNLAKATVTPDLAGCYGARSFAVLEQLGLRRAELSGATLADRFGQFDADAGWLDEDAGFADLAAVTRALTAALAARGVRIREQAEVRGIARGGGTGPAGPAGQNGPAWQVATGDGVVASDALVITAGHGSNDLLAMLPGCSLRFPLRPDRPVQSKYFIPPAAVRDRYTERALPVFAYLDAGIYGHPIYDGHTPGVKIGFYQPPDAPVVARGISSVEDFAGQCLPELRGARTVDVAVADGVDTCSYDLVADDEFIIGPVPGADGVYAGTGWRGTGYKFAPWVGLVLARLALGQPAGYDLSRFAPGRFSSVPKIQHPQP